MKTRRKMVKRWIAGVLAVTMLSSTMSTAAFAAPESTDAPETVETTRVTAWNWTDGSALTWQEDTSAWTLTLSEEQTISAEADLLALLPVSVEATLAQAEAEATPAPDTAATPAPESTPDTEATEVTPTPVAEVDPAAEEGATAPAAAVLAQPEEGATGADTLSVEPQNNEEATPAPETATPAPTAAPQPAESPAPTADAEPTEEPAATETLTLTWDTAALTYPLAGGDYTVTAALPEGYTLDEAAPALAVVVKVPGAEDEDTPAADNSLSDGASAPSMMANAGTVQTVNPVGTTINLFDYWYSSKGEKTDDFKNTSYLLPRRTYKDSNWWTGINQNHVLKFSPFTGTISFDGVSPIDKANKYTGTGQGPYPNIVANKLQDGYPVLNSTTVEGSVVDIWGLGSYKDVETLTNNESLSYLFNPGDMSTDDREAYTDVKDLFYIDEKGYYTYDSSEYFAKFEPDGSGSGSFTLSDPSSLGFDNSNGQFFPFNNPSDSKESANHFFGLTMTTHFMQPTDGLAANGEPIVYNFTGDDDVWVFIDGVLVGDLGGIHDAATLSIDFNTGEIITGNAENSNHNITSYLIDKFKAAGEYSEGAFKDKTFADGTYHTLQFFFLERGANKSNLKLRFNLVSAPESTIESVDQNGNGVNATSFTLYSANESYGENAVIATGTTSNDGKLVLEDVDGRAIGLQDLWASLEQSKLVFQVENTTQYRANLVLQQQLPEGYRGTDTVHLYLLKSGDNVLLLSDNTWETGAYAYSNSTITLDSTQLTSWDGNNHADLATTGTLFAVVLRRDPKDVGNTDPENSNWYMMTGDATNGWQMSKDPVNNDVQKVLDLYSDQTKNNYYVVKRNSSGGYDTTVSDLPGDVTKYYYMLDVANKKSAEYNVAFYYTSASSLDQAAVGNTWMVKNTGTWKRVFSTNVYVANIKNYLLVQQLSPDGTAVNGAEFALYGADYYKEDATVNPDATPIDTATTSHLSTNIELDGGAYFPSSGKALTPGTYYLVQTKAVAGYTINTKPTKIIVDDTGVYADAGDADDGIQVARGVGSVVKSLAEFASSPDIDATLNNIVGKFYTTATVPDNGNFEEFTWRTLGSDNGSTPAEDVTYHPSYWYTDGTYSLAGVGNKPADAEELGMHMEYGTNEAILEYGPGEDISKNMAAGESAIYWMTTDKDWSNLMIEQCKVHSEELQQQGKSYQDLTGKDLTNLFSRSVVVRVTNQVQPCNLTISNVVVNPVGNDRNQPFTVTVTLAKGDGAQLEGSYAYVGKTLQGTEFEGVSAPENGQLTLAEGQADVTLTYGQVITIQDIPYGTQFTVTATSENYTASYTVTAGDTSPLNDGSGPHVLQADSTVAITNTRKAGSVAVSNTVEGAMGSYSDEFSYTLKLYDKTADDTNPAIDGTYDATLVTKDNQTGQAMKITFENGQATEMTPVVEGEQQQEAKAITLAHGDTLTISGLPAGASFEAAETDDHKGYTVAVNPPKTGEDGASVSRTGLVTVPNSADVTPTSTIAFTNTREAIVPTGMREENNPYIVMIGLAGMAALVGAAGWVEMRRRKRREEE